METMTLCTKLCVDEIVHGGENILASTIREEKNLLISALFVISAADLKSWMTTLWEYVRPCSRKLSSG
jgi:hypothetical protein